MGGLEPHGLVQGPRDDGGRLEGGRGGREGGDLRLDRQHGRFAAAYAARAGMPAVVLTRRGGRRREGRPDTDARGQGARGARRLRRGARGRTGARPARTHVLVNSVNPHRRAGQKTAVFEIVEELGAAPDAFVIPYGGGGNTSAYATAIGELGLATPIYSVEAERPRRRRSPPRSGSAIPSTRDSVRASGGDGRDRQRRGDRRGLARARDGRGSLLRAVLGGRARGRSARRRRGRAARRHDHGPRPEGHGGAEPVRSALRQVDADPDAIAAAARRR